MPNPIQEGSSRSKAPRRVNSDGTITVVCRICGKPLIRMMYQGFSTVTCSDCKGIPTDGVVTGATILPDGQVVYNAEQLADAILYPESPEIEKIGLARSVFRALGFGRPKEPLEPAKESKKVSRERRRKPIFGPEDDKE